MGTPDFVLDMKKAPVNIFNSALEIDLDAINELIRDYPEDGRD
ncbi:MAG: hypothetical protein UHN47_17780 [Lachnospiraceae bacterium]|nr:hypothetical protein [Lachnospiraceae bacterium]